MKSVVRGILVERREQAHDATSEFDARGTLVVSGGHFTNDLYVSFLGPLIPAVQSKLGISLFIGSLMVPAHQIPSIFQPFIGAWADRTSKRWFVVFSPAVVAIATSSVGLAPNVAVILVLLFTSGMASAAFHAPAVALVGEYSGSQTGRAMSYFMAGGEAARTLGPFVITGAISIFTLEGSWVVLFFGIVATVILFLTIDTSASDLARRDRVRVALKPLLRVRRKMLLGLFGFAATVNLYIAPFSFFLVAYLIDQGHGGWFAGLSLSAFFAACGMGGIIGGSVSDRFGRRPVLFASVLVSPVLLFLYLAFNSYTAVGLILLMAAGVIGLANRPIQLALAQDILPEARGTMSGLALAFGFVTISLFALIFGVVADWVGLEVAFWFVPLLAFVSIPFVFLLPRRGQVLPQPF